MGFFKLPYTDVCRSELLKDFEVLKPQHMTKLIDPNSDFGQFNFYTKKTHKVVGASYDLSIIADKFSDISKLFLFGGQEDPEYELRRKYDYRFVYTSFTRSNSRKESYFQAGIRCATVRDLWIRVFMKELDFVPHTSPEGIIVFNFLAKVVILEHMRIHRILHKERSL